MRKEVDSLAQKMAPSVRFALNSLKKFLARLISVGDHLNSCFVTVLHIPYASCPSLQLSVYKICLISSVVIRRF